MPVYDPITNVMPVASMVTNAVVSAALCDQIRDDLVALYDGWWFRATRSTNFTMTSSVVTPVPMDAVAISRTATADGTVVLAPTAVTIGKPGVWWLGFSFAFSSAFTGLVDLLLDATDAAGSMVAEALTDANTQATNWCVSGMVNVTTLPQTVTPNLYTVGTPTVTTSPPAMFWGVWLGDSP